MSAADPSRPPAAAAGATAPNWADPARHAAFNAWLARVAAMHGLLPASLRVASADASFRRYFRIDCADGASRIVMDAPPAQENCAPFVQVAGLMRDAGLNVPRILDWDETGGFMLMTDLGARTMMEVIERDHPEANRALYAQALDALLAWQQASRPGVLPPYDEALLRRELRLFPDWYLQRHRGVTLDGAQAETLERQFALIVERNLAAPRVYVHRDFMPRNLMVSGNHGQALGVLCVCRGKHLCTLTFLDALAQQAGRTECQRHFLSGAGFVVTRDVGQGLPQTARGVNLNGGHVDHGVRRTNGGGGRRAPYQRGHRHSQHPQAV